MKQSGVEVNAHVSYRGVGFFVYDCKVFGDNRHKPMQLVDIESKKPAY